MNDDVQALLQDGQSKLYARSFEIASERFQAAIALAPENAESHIWLGQAYAALGQPDLALHEFHHAARLDPDNSEPYLCMVNIFRSRADSQSELHVLETASRLLGNSAGRQMALGYLAAYKRDFEKALMHYYYAADWQPNERRSASAIGQATLCLGRNEEARKALLQATAHPDASPEDFYHLGVAEQRLHNLDAALQAYKAAVDKDHSFIKAYVALTALEIRMGKWLSAWHHLWKLAGLNRNDP